MSDFEAQCDCELDSPGVLSHLPVGERLKHWTDWALYLKRRIETHYRPRIAALEAELERLVGERDELRRWLTAWRDEWKLNVAALEQAEYKLKGAQEEIAAQKFYREQAEEFAALTHPEAWKRVAQLTASENRKDNALKKAVETPLADAVDEMKRHVIAGRGEV